MGGTEAAFGIVTILSGGAVILGGLSVLRDRLRERTPPEKLLARRFAAGELNHDEYLVALSVLNEARELSRPQ